MMRHAIDSEVSAEMDAAVSRVLSPRDRTTLTACLNEWLATADAVDGFIWIDADTISARCEVAENHQLRAAEIADSMGSLTLGSVSRPRNGGRIVPDRLLEVVGIRNRNGQPVSWRVRPGGGLRQSLLEHLVERVGGIQLAPDIVLESRAV
jgi:hypothetical protein